MQNTVDAGALLAEQLNGETHTKTKDSNQKASSNNWYKMSSSKSHFPVLSRTLLLLSETLSVCSSCSTCVSPRSCSAKSAAACTEHFRRSDCFFFFFNFCYGLHLLRFVFSSGPHFMFDTFLRVAACY